MSKEEIRSILNDIEDLKQFKKFVKDSKKESDVKITAKSLRLSFLGDVITYSQKMEIESKTLIEILEELIKKKEKKIDEVLGD